MSGFSELVAARCSCRAYRTDPVPRDALEKILEAARRAPSACNRQPWRFVVATEGPLRKQLLADGTLPGLGMTWGDNAPVILVLGIKKSLITHRVAGGHPATGNDYSRMACGNNSAHFSPAYSG